MRMKWSLSNKEQQEYEVNAKRIMAAGVIPHEDGPSSEPQLLTVEQAGGPLAGCGKTRFEWSAVPQNSLVSTTQPDKKKVCVDKTSNSWMCSAT